MQKLKAVGQDQRSAMRAAEFFAGIGLVRLGLESAGFDVVWSNDIEPAKHAMYVGHFGEQAGSHRFVLGDIADVKGADMPPDLSLAWASFPCIDLSLAGWRRGLEGSHSGTFWHFAEVLDEMGDARPGVVVLENVVGLATSHDGKDLAAAVRELNRLGYSADVLTLDARRFVPQSRPRLFIVGARQAPTGELSGVSVLRPEWLQRPFSDPALVTHQAALPEPPALLAGGLAAIVGRSAPVDELTWWDATRTEAFLGSLSPVQAKRVAMLRQLETLAYRTAYRRTRHGKAVWEVRSDDISGCLRTARGGSSKQAVVEAGCGAVRVRWMTAREYARLMGTEEYRLEGIRRNQALFGFGDAVCVPVVGWLAEHYLLPLVRGDMSAESPLHLAVASA